MDVGMLGFGPSCYYVNADLVCLPIRLHPDSDEMDDIKLKHFTTKFVKRLAS